MLTLQEIFEKSAKGILGQGCKSLAPLSDDSSPDCCMYRGKGGTKCAVGWVIEDKYYDKDFEGTGVYTTLPSTCNPPELLDALVRSGVDVYDPRTMRFLSKLQDIHDKCSVDEWTKELLWLAHQFDLDTKFMQEFE